ncbi:MAG: helix-turn-helix domain-containing protein [Acidimicrobiia bacterium]|nr:helix-turn-helix domain-containing protein [Acidimicrobiia bacterium]
MTAVVVGSALERAHLARALADHVGRHGRDHVPESLAALSDALSRQSPPDAATAIDSLDGDAESGLVTYTDAAGMLGISARTVSRRVADGQLDTVGRRITRSSLEALSKGRR